MQVWKKERWKWRYHRQRKAQDYFRGKGRGSIFYEIKIHWKSFKERTASSRLTTGRKTMGLKYKSKLLNLSYLLNQVQKGDYTQKDKGPRGVSKVSKEWITWKPTEKILQELQKLELEGAGHKNIKVSHNMRANRAQSVKYHKDVVRKSREIWNIYLKY